MPVASCLSLQDVVVEKMTENVRESMERCESLELPLVKLRPPEKPGGAASHLFSLKNRVPFLSPKRQKAAGDEEARAVVGESGDQEPGHYLEFEGGHPFFLHARGPPFPLPPAIADRLVRSLNAKELLTDETLQLFRRKYARLESFVLTEGKKVTLEGLRVLKEHALNELRLTKMPALDVSRLVEQCLSPESKERTLKFLDLGGSFGSAAHGAGGKLPALDKGIKAVTLAKALTGVSFANSLFNGEHLKTLCGVLTTLDYLDLSNTDVEKIGPLTGLLHLRVLLLHKVRIAGDAEIDCLITTLKNNARHLEVLDVSDMPKVDAERGAVTRGTVGSDVVKKFQGLAPDGSDRLHSLLALDVSGNQSNFDTDLFAPFLAAHPKLEFLGLLLTNAASFDEVMSRKDLQVAGDANRRQMICALETYGRNGREFYASRILHNVYDQLQHSYDAMKEEELKRIFTGLIRTLKEYGSNLSVQMAGTACLFNLCRGRRTENMDENADLPLVVDRCLDALAAHPSTLQLHKNVWLTLCNDQILQAKNCRFDMYRCCEAALESMVTQNDVQITRMTVAIISILAAKIPTSRSASLGDSGRYMQFLVEIVRGKTEEYAAALAAHVPGHAPPQPDITLKFTLSALWNLTDESPATCGRFLAEDGLAIVLKALNTFDLYGIQTKVLGLLNNVAEVEDLKSHLATTHCLDSFTRMLESEKIEVSYFAAGILSHLAVTAALPPPPGYTWGQCDDSLAKRVLMWQPPENEMVAYRSFRPFFPLLRSRASPGIQLWATWAIQHVCSKSPGRYVDLFREQGGLEAVGDLLAQLGEEEEEAGEPLRAAIRANAAQIRRIIGGTPD